MTLPPSPAALAALLKEREMSADDWKALYLVMQLAKQVCLHGCRALVPFANAIVERDL